MLVEPVGRLRSLLLVRVLVRRGRVGVVLRRSGRRFVVVRCVSGRVVHVVDLVMVLLLGEVMIFTEPSKSDHQQGGSERKMDFL